MTIEKTRCIILAVMPYRETSAIVQLLSRGHGRVSGIARGVRGPRARGIMLERGLFVESMLYVKPHRDLHTMGETTVLCVYPRTRAHLSRSTVRDAAFELVLRSVIASDTHGELFDLLLAFLEKLDAARNGREAMLLWSFLCDWSVHCGFALNLRECVRCARQDDLERTGGSLSHEQGGLVCVTCAGKNSKTFLSPDTLSLLYDPTIKTGELSALPDLLNNPREQLRITRLLVDYCRYHLEIRGDFKSLDFMESMAGL